MTIEEKVKTIYIFPYYILMCTRLLFRLNKKIICHVTYTSHKTRLLAVTLVCPWTR